MLQVLHFVQDDKDIPAVALNYLTLLQAAPPETDKQKVDNNSEFHDPSRAFFQQQPSDRFKPGGHFR